MCLLALITLLGGLFLLGYSKKEGLGKFSKLASYLAITFSTIVFVIGLIGTMMCPSKCGSGQCSKGMNEEKCMMIKKECMEGQACHKDMNACSKNMNGSCDSTKSCCADMKICPKSEDCNTPAECAAKMKNCDAACMAKCEKEKGACDAACKKKCDTAKK